MLGLLKKKAEDAAAQPETPPSRDLSEFVPYYAHYNAHTLLTKNGEVMQIIKIAQNNRDLTYESSDVDGQTLREHIRKAIVETIKNDRYAIWVHTIRRRKNVRYSGRFDDPFAAYMQAGWKNKHHWKYQYYNEIYISILHEGQGGDLIDKKALKNIVFPKPNRTYRNRFLDNAAA